MGVGFNSTDRAYGLLPYLRYYYASVPANVIIMVAMNDKDLMGINMHYDSSPFSDFNVWPDILCCK